MATRAPDSAARAAAASPAGPAPITTTSNAGSGIGLHLHARFAGNLTALAMSAAVDGHAAFETDAHPAQRRARLPGDRPAKLRRPGNCNRGGDHGAYGHLNGVAIHAKTDPLIHASAPWSAGTAPRE